MPRAVCTRFFSCVLSHTRYRMRDAFIQFCYFLLLNFFVVVHLIRADERNEAVSSLKSARYLPLYNSVVSKSYV